jgi:hypothetical protein
MENEHDEVPPLPAPRARQFSDTEVDAILRRAALADADFFVPQRQDTTLDDLVAAAAEAGLDPADVRRAAAVVPPAPDGPIARLLGGADRRVVTAYLPGVSPPDRRTELAGAVERGLGRRGEVRPAAVEGRFEWRSRSSGVSAVVEVAERDGGTEIVARAEHGAYYLGLWLVGLGGWAALSALTPVGALGPMGIAASLLLVPVLIARPFWRRADRRLRQRLERTVFELARVVEEDRGVGPAPGEGGLR